MSKLYDIYKKLKNENNETIYLFKSGVFYICLDDDAKILSKIYNLKLTNLNVDIVKCGFPCSSFDKYYKLFVNDNINFKIVENNTIFDGADYLQNKTLLSLLEKINQVSVDNLSVSEAYRFIEEVKELTLKLK